MPPSLAISRGQIWEVRFDPSEGDEIKKVRPAVVLTAEGVGKMALQIVVPITGWQAQFARYPWMVRILPNSTNGLSKESSADAFQIKSLSINRFQNNLGVLTNDEIDDLAAAVALCVGYRP